jgi:hypothetical protein
MWKFKLATEQGTTRTLDDILRPARGQTLTSRQLAFQCYGHLIPFPFYVHRDTDQRAFVSDIPAEELGYKLGARAPAAANNVSADEYFVKIPIGH